MANQVSPPSADTRKKFDTLDAEYTHLIFEAARLVDAGDTTKLETVRARRDVVKAELRRRSPSFDRWEC